MSGSKTPSLGVEPLKFNPEDPIHATRIGNIVFFAPSALKPSEFPSHLPFEQHDLHLLKKGLENLKEETQTRVDQLKSNQGNGQTLSHEDQDWLDDGGNLITEHLIVDILLSLEEFKPLKLCLDKFKAIQSIHHLMLSIESF